MLINKLSSSFGIVNVKGSVKDNSDYLVLHQVTATANMVPFIEEQHMTVHLCIEISR